VRFAKGSKPNARQVVVSLEDANKMIEACQRVDLLFVLFCGFHAGMRAGEIRHSRVAWFDLARGVIAIPAEENQTLPNKRRHGWKTKDGDAREIPISRPFMAFLSGFLASKRGHCLPSKKAKDGLWDFRLPFAKFMQEQGRGDVFPHAMRHSWITELTNSGNHTMQEIAAWSGDRLETIEANYWKRKTEAGALDDTLAGIKRPREDREALRAIAAGRLAPFEY
jgi:integrase